MVYAKPQVLELNGSYFIKVPANTEVEFVKIRSSIGKTGYILIPSNPKIQEYILEIQGFLHYSGNNGIIIEQYLGPFNNFRLKNLHLEASGIISPLKPNYETKTLFFERLAAGTTFLAIPSANFPVPARPYLVHEMLVYIGNGGHAVVRYLPTTYQSGKVLRPMPLSLFRSIDFDSSLFTPANEGFGTEINCVRDMSSGQISEDTALNQSVRCTIIYSLI